MLPAMLALLIYSNTISK
uniref:Uncharacterized protein n=1 Tax=Anguilla anguilla TaxID=7936 RepID=A0A0E9UPK7_ANGAN